MDFDLFEYDAAPFFELCSTGKQDPIWISLYSVIIFSQAVTLTLHYKFQAPPRSIRNIDSRHRLAELQVLLGPRPDERVVEPLSGGHRGRVEVARQLKNAKS